MQDNRQNVKFDTIYSETISYFIGEVVEALNSIFEKKDFSLGISDKDIFWKVRKLPYEDFELLTFVNPV